MNLRSSSLLFHRVIAYLSVQLPAQPVSKIEGYLEVSHPDDTTSINFGKEADRVTDDSFIRKNTILGNPGLNEINRQQIVSNTLIYHNIE
jgi:hypothetical protein